MMNRRDGDFASSGDGGKGELQSEAFSSFSGDEGGSLNDGEKAFQNNDHGEDLRAKTNPQYVYQNAPTIVLIEPQLENNIGAVARAMLNFNVQNLRMVNPCVDHLSDTTRRKSAGADVVLENAAIYDNLNDALSDMDYVVGTIAKPRDIVCRYETPRHFFNTAPVDFGISNQPNIQNYAIVFGPERTGLTNDHIVKCAKLITIPTHDGFTSLNLAQAVLILCYEWFQSQNQKSGAFLHYGETRPSNHGQRQYLYGQMELLLDCLSYWRVPSKKPIMWRNIQGFLNRIDFTHQDIQTTLGIFSDILKKLDLKE